MLFRHNALIPLVLLAAIATRTNGQELLPGSNGILFNHHSFAPDGTQLLAVAYRPLGGGVWVPDALWLFDRARGTNQVLFRPGADQNLRAAAFAPNGKTIVAGGHCCWAEWRLPSLKQKFLIKGCPEALNKFTVSTFCAPRKTNTLVVNVIHQYEQLDGRQGSDSKILLWNLNRHRKEELFRISKNKINTTVDLTLTIAPSGRMLAFVDPAAKRLKVIHVEPTSAPKERISFPLPAAKENDGSRLQFAPDEASVWRLDVGNVMTQFDLKNKKARALKLEDRIDWIRFLPEEPALLAVRYVEKTKKNEVLFIRSSNGEVVTRITLPKVCHAYALSPDGRWLAGCASEGGIYLWDTHLWHKRRKGE